MTRNCKDIDDLKAHFYQGIGYPIRVHTYLINSNLHILPVKIRPTAH